tara:strand:- start:3264 stop:4247 length:984 start_codon:yes stop_codon:yes gene_type:complete
MKIGIAILNWNGLDLLKDNLGKVIRRSDNSNIYIIDNNSSDKSIEYVKDNFPEVKVISLEKNYGFAEGYNLGLKKVNENIVCIMNNDIQVTDNWLDPIRNLINKNPISIIQPTIMDLKNKNYYEYAGAAGGFIDKFGYPYCRGRVFDTLEKNNGQYQDDKIFWASGACMFIQKKLFYEIGGFDKSFFAHMEEVDLCWRAFNKGIKCFSSTKSIVYHLGAATIKVNSKKNYFNYRNSLIMLTKNLPLGSLLYVIFIRIILDIISAIYYTIKGRFDLSISVIKAHLDYFRKVKKYLKGRDNNSKKENYYEITSVVFKYFVLGKKKFFTL